MPTSMPVNRHGRAVPFAPTRPACLWVRIQRIDKVELAHQSRNIEQIETVHGKALAGYSQFARGLCNPTFNSKLSSMLSIRKEKPTPLRVGFSSKILPNLDSIDRQSDVAALCVAAGRRRNRDRISAGGGSANRRLRLATAASWLQPE